MRKKAAMRKMAQSKLREPWTRVIKFEDSLVTKVEIFLNREPGILKLRPDNEAC